MSSLFKRKGSGCCVAVGCSMRKGTNLLSAVQLFKFPKNAERRKQWEVAVHRENWKATDSSQLCNLHFITGKPSADPVHPDYVPSIFSFQKGHAAKNDSVNRYERNLKRKKTDTSDFEDSNADDHIQAVSSIQTTEISTMTELTMKDIQKFEEQKQAYESTINVLQQSAKESTTSSRIMNNSKMFDFYTKLPNTAFFYSLLSYILSNWKPTTKTRLEYSEQLLLVLMKLRLGLLNEDISYRFSIGAGTASKIFREWIARMAFVLSNFIIQPSANALKENLPKCFVEANLQNVSRIVDCSEIFIERPFNLDARASTYSNYKHHNTVKFLVSCTPSGGISFISKTYGGRISDKDITKRSGFLKNIKKNEVILADRGFRIEELLALKNATVIVPSSTKGRKQLPGEQVTKSRIISRVRIHIERCIGRMKMYGILKHTWPITFLSYSVDGKFCTGDNILIVIAALCNISRTSIVKSST